MEFRTLIKPKPQQEHQIDHQSTLLLLGSCFSDHIGDQLKHYKFKTCTNPFGTLFSPSAIQKVIEDTILQKKHETDDLIKQGDLFHSLNHHSSLSAQDSKTAIDNIQKAQNIALTNLKSASHIIITLGTAWAYNHIKTTNLVANCHKIAGSEFKKQLLSVEEVCCFLQKTIELIQTTNANTQIIFTLSPVRHTKDGFTENALSKAHLLSAIHKVTNKNVSYFESYEIMMDDLRGYRFYEADMIHPNNTAIQYIWEHFCETWIDQKSKTFFKQIHSIQQGLKHKPFHQNSDAHQLFLKKLKQKQKVLEHQLNIQF